MQLTQTRPFWFKDLTTCRKVFANSEGAIMKLVKQLSVALALASILMVVSCGGGGTSTTATVTPPVSVIADDPTVTTASAVAVVVLTAM